MNIRTTQTCDIRTTLTYVCVALVLAACGSEMKSSGTSDADKSTRAVGSESTATDATKSISTDAEESTDVTGNVDERIDAAQEALQDGNFTLMLEVLNLSGVADEIRDKEVTMLAPNDDAFGEMDGAEYADLLTNPTKVDDLLKRHIIEGVLTYQELSGLTAVTTMGDETLPVSFVDGVLMVGAATVLEPVDDAVSGEDGQEVAVLEIDSVLLEAP